MKPPSGRAARIRLLVLDVDGVLTDGGLSYGPSGEESKRFHVHDGLAIVAAQRAGLRVALMSGRASASVTRRAAELGITEVHQGIEDKAAVLTALTARLGLAPELVAVMGDDLGDLPLMRGVGLALAPQNAVPEVRRAAHWVARRRGGDGAVRQAVELLLRARNAWPPPEASDGAHQAAPAVSPRKIVLPTGPGRGRGPRRSSRSRGGS